MSRERRDPDLVRAYVRTGGISRPTRDLDLVTLVVATNVPQSVLTPDQRRVIGLCSRHGALSIAEIAAHLDLPPSVAKIVVSGLMDADLLATPAPAADDVSDAAMLKEVLIGLHKLAG